MISSFKSVPPVVTIMRISKCLASSMQIWLVWSASSRVGTTIKAVEGKSNGNSPAWRSQRKIVTLDMPFCWNNLFQDRYTVSACLSCSILSSCQNITSREGHRDTNFLNGRRSFPALFENSHEKFTLQTEVLKTCAFSVSYILKWEK